jgi:hypothetical protein
MRRVVGIAGACILLMSLLATPAAASTTTLVNCGAGADLQAAINAASPGDTLLIRGTCVGNFTVAKDLNFKGQKARPTIAGAPASTAPVLDLGPVLAITITGLTITGGAGDGIHTMLGKFGDLTLADSSVTDNALYGIFIDPYGATKLTMDRSTVSGNAGGGLACYGLEAEISRSVIRDNAQGGITNACAMTLTNTVVKGNTTGWYGGGIWNRSTMVGRGQLTLVRSEVIGNTSDGSGAGIYSEYQATIIDSVVRNNGAGGNGGGVFNGTWRTATYELVLGILTIRNSRIAHNTAGLAGGGLYNEGDLTLDSVVIKSNTPDDCVGAGC